MLLLSSVLTVPGDIASWNAKATIAASDNCLEDTKPMTVEAQGIEGSTIQLSMCSKPKISKYTIIHTFCLMKYRSALLI